MRSVKASRANATTALNDESGVGFAALSSGESQHCFGRADRICRVMKPGSRSGAMAGAGRAVAQSGCAGHWEGKPSFRLAEPKNLMAGSLVFFWGGGGHFKPVNHVAGKILAIF